ncbi:uncharacterized protein BXZ73DRAFT_50084 [Epithele typhae]|uniref:uncharacterized protein n=1 Tax=Epithele typhae TaxID=378194 RepID=UPI0020073F27|nr:uncharacterized protein BXZ73DRAFT_50084 [Epithele typhae]KAH9925352.1 hypothetical protein BXZ73DRAFT_50084 [Epithele typhae]
MNTDAIVDRFGALSTIRSRSCRSSPDVHESRLSSPKGDADPPAPRLATRRDEEFYSQDIVFLVRIYTSFVATCTRCPRPPRSPIRGHFHHLHFGPDTLMEVSPAQVDGVLFKVLRKPFENESKAFGDTLELPPADHPQGHEGESDANPLRLEGVTEDEFRALLRVLFRPQYGPTRTYDKAHWIAVLKLSTMWLFDTLRDTAIEEIARYVAAPLDRIELARTYDIPHWCEPAFAALCRQERLSPEELERLGWNDGAKLVHVRESMEWADACTCGCNYCTITHGPAVPRAAVVHPHTHPGARPGAVSTTVLRRNYDFGPKLREVFGTALY